MPSAHGKRKRSEPNYLLTRLSGTWINNKGNNCTVKIGHSPRSSQLDSDMFSDHVATCTFGAGAPVPIKIVRGLPKVNDWLFCEFDGKNGVTWQKSGEKNITWCRPQIPTLEQLSGIWINSTGVHCTVVGSKCTFSSGSGPYTIKTGHGAPQLNGWHACAFDRKNGVTWKKKGEENITWHQQNIPEKVQKLWFWQRTESLKVCIICMDAPVDSAFVHGDTLHQCCCWKCANKVKKGYAVCPVCKQHIDRICRSFTV